MRFKRTPLLALALAATLTTLLPTSANAAPVAPTPLQRCTDAAVQRGELLWTCVGGTLTYLAPVKALAPASEPARVTAAEGVPEWKTEVIAADRQQRTPASSAAVSPMGSGDEWDTWCETGTVCTRPISAYISETKGNGAYGDQNGAIGSFDLILRTNLSGGQPRYNVGINQDSGPLLTVNSTINCVWDKLFDGTCGHFAVPQVYVGNYRSNLIYGTRVPSSGTYFSTLTGNFTPDGRANMAFAALQTAKFNCSSVTVCSF